VTGKNRESFFMPGYRRRNRSRIHTCRSLRYATTGTLTRAARLSHCWPHSDGDTRDVLNGERRYDASTGDWTTQDPLGFGGGDANPGRYAGNSPTNVAENRKTGQNDFNK
jgi:RHS repeat-associated protein